MSNYSLFMPRTWCVFFFVLDQGTPEYATILAFDVKIDSDARRHADESSVQIFTADIIYHLFDQFTAYMDRLMEQRRQDAKNLAVFPCIVKVCFFFFFAFPYDSFF